MDLEKLNYEQDVVDETSGARPLTAASTSIVLERVINDSTGNVVVFDLDSTLLNNKPRSARIMREYGRAKAHPLLVDAMPGHWNGWSARTAMANMGLSSAEIDRHIEDFLKFWKARFFTSEYCVEDVAIDGAVEFVQRVHSAGATIVYLTGRPEHMRAGTRECFRALEFPEQNEQTCFLYMKLDPDESDDVFKRNAISSLRSLGSIVAAFDNEPAHINLYKNEFPDALSAHLFTDHSMRNIQLDEGIISIRDFCCPHITYTAEK